MKISELAAETEVNAKTIRYYEEIGLISPAERANNGYRNYKSKDVETLIFIRRCRELNIPLDDIKQLIDAQAEPTASCALVDEIIANQLARIKQTQQELALLEASLTAMACCSQQQIQDCDILQQLKSK